MNNINGIAPLSLRTWYTDIFQEKTIFPFFAISRLFYCGARGFRPPGHMKSINQPQMWAPSPVSISIEVSKAVASLAVQLHTAHSPITEDTRRCATTRDTTHNPSNNETNEMVAIDRVIFTKEDPLSYNKEHNFWRKYK